MKRLMLQTGLLLMLGAFAFAQDAPPSGTHPSPREPGAVRPTKKHVDISSDTVRAAQEKLAAGGYYTGAATGTVDAGTRAAIRKFQAAEGITVNGRLDQSTLSHLNISGGSTLKAAPGDIGRGGKAAGHNVKEGHPIEAGKAIGEGTGHSAKKVGEGTKSTAVEGGTAVGEGAKEVGSGAKEGGKTVGKGAKEGAEEVGSAAKQGAKKVAKGVKKGVKKVTGQDDDDRKPAPPSPPPQM